jgi:CheY-like chemotaxis protein
MLLNGSLVALTSEGADFARIVSDLQGSGVQPRHADDLLDAVLACLHHRPDVLVMDADSVNWRQALEVLREVRSFPVIFLVRYAEPALRQQMLQAGAADVIEKSYRRLDLQWAVIYALESRPMAAAMSA